MTRLAPLLSVLLVGCFQWRQVQSQTGFKPLNPEPYGTDSITSETIYDAGKSFSNAENYGNPDDYNYNSPVTPESERYSTYSSDDAGSQYARTEDVVTSGDNENSTTPVGADAYTANEEGFDLFEDGDDSSSTSSSDDFGIFAASGGCSTGNPVDDCWRCDPNWASRRQSLANCAVGFGKGAVGGRNGKIYVVTSAGDDNPANPSPGTLRYAVTRLEPLWITFAYSMTIKLKNELLITSYKTIDGRGVTVRIAGGGGLTMQRVNNVIVHGIAIQDIKSTGPARIMTSTAHTGNRGKCDGDAISIFSSKNIWIDHCFLSNAADGLIDVIRGSTAVSITNNYFTKHDKVMLLGASKNDVMDRDMYVTIAYNTFGPGLVQRMPRVRFGNAHVVNNDYSSGWSMYAIAGSEGPTILSQGNVFNAVTGSKQVTKRIDDGGQTFGGPTKWNWRSEGDSFLSGAFFTSVQMSWSGQSYAKTASCSARPASMVKAMVRGSGPLSCRPGAKC